MTFPSRNEKLAFAAYLEHHSDLKLPAQADNLDQALQVLDQPTSVNAHCYTDQYARLKRYFTSGILVLMLMSFVIGLMVTPSSFLLNESKHINIYWLLLTLLGFHLINLLLWLGSLIWLHLKPNQNNNPLLLSVLSFLHHKVSQWLAINVNVSKAFWQWQSSKQSQTWLASSLSHGAWLSYLSAGLFMTLLLLLTNQVSFIWETTLLSDSRFLALTQWLSTPLTWLGLDLPTQADILSSRIDQTLQSQATRQHWANFLLASLIMYGLLPRLLLLLMCLALYRIKRITRKRSPQEDIILNRYAHQETQQKRIIDPDHLQRHNHGSEHNKILSICQVETNSLWGLYEWSDDIPTRLMKTNTQLLNDQAQQHAFLALAPEQMTYLLVSNAHSPDRGTTRFLTSLATQQPRVQMVLWQTKSGQFDDAWIALSEQLKLPALKCLPEE
ncbi:DUF2868 domain-containing protein [Marinomonas sp. TW1]|uniref:DUF2868 domain-containing protein n=1 Tax=Marinomonas sp. TW1 TaxID=1561203 RepID=UPI0007AF41A4|nr:DUF2868 domain-containing protein [Marinomonas sp. TW1]KZN13858.1 hypothetical protein OA79_09070 [Marinomonas sp. TW1]